MAYHLPLVLHYTMPLFDFGGGAAEVYSFRGPRGKTGKLIELGVSVTEVFAVDTTTGKVRLGTAADNDAFAELNIADGTADEAFFDDANSDTDAIINPDIPADTLVEVNLVNGTDASVVTGQGIPMWTIEWY